MVVPPLTDAQIMALPPPPGVVAAQWAIAAPAGRRAMLAAAPPPPGTPPPAGQAAAPGAPPPAPAAPATPATLPPVTADQIRAIMPTAGPLADQYVDALNTSMTAHGFTTAAQQAAFLAQISVESGDLHRTTEDLYYTAPRMQVVWPTRFPTLASATPFARNPQALGNHVYADRLGNGNEASGDGYLFRGRGLMQVTGRENYRAQGLEANPESLANPITAAGTAATFWQNNNLNAQTQTALDRAAFDQISRTVNGGIVGINERWNAYQRALTAVPGASGAPAPTPPGTPAPTPAPGPRP